MSTFPMYRKCHKCGNVYSLNPSVGVFACPKCGTKTVEDLVKVIKGLKVVRRK